MYISLIILCAGIISGFLLTCRHPFLRDETAVKEKYKISVIIPARNEEKNLPNILSDLNNQDTGLFEIICVDDSSEDRTADVINSYGAKLVSVKDKPAGWTGKSYACQTGANCAKGDLFLFLDADVRIGKSAIGKLLKAYENSHCTVSVQPFHKVYKLYEQLSLFFNLIMIAANGVSLPFRSKNIGLFGPVILISREDYFTAGGHFSVKESIVDDLALGKNLKDEGLKFKLYLGGHDISFRMYADGFKQLKQGWIKNFAAGALKTSFPVMVMMILWLGACTTGALNFIHLIFDFTQFKLVSSLITYFIVVLVLWAGTRKIGSFKPAAYIFYPVELFTFIALFLYSMFKKVFKIKVSWKGRKI